MRSFSAPWLVISVGLLPFSARPQEQAKTAQPPTEQSSGIRFEQGKLTARFTNRSLQWVSEQLAARTGVSIVVGDTLESFQVSADVHGVAIEDALRRIFSGFDTFFFYDGSKSLPASLRTVWVYRKGSAAALKPVRPEDWASSRELQFALKDTDSEVRALAYEALISRPDQRSRSLVIDALRGIGERDSGLRERLLSSVISKGFAIPPEVLADLVRADSSDLIRCIALDALSEHPSAKQIAEAAMTDPSEAVRARAKEVLLELGNERSAVREQSDHPK